MIIAFSIYYKNKYNFLSQFISGAAGDKYGLRNGNKELKNISQPGMENLSS
jgi:hypothetical protein